MYTLKLYFLKLLKRIKLLSKINFILTRTINNKLIRIPFINGIGLPNFVLEKDWLDYLIYTFVQHSNGSFIDVGVNVGQTLLRVKSISPNSNYIGFEPNSTCTSYSQQLIKLNNFSHCIIYNCALSNRVQNLVLEKTLVDDCRASVVSSLRPDYFNEVEYVLALDYQSYFIDKNISFVKIDVEGGEYEVLVGMKSAIEKYQPVITCEVLDSHNQEVLEFTQQRATLVSEFLSSINYRIIQLQTNNSRIVSFKQIDSINIKQWTPASYGLNDYLFYPLKSEDIILTNLNELILNLK